MTKTDHEDERPDECENCAFETTVKPYRVYRGFPNVSYKWLCELCAGTPAGNAYEYPEQFRNVPLFQTVCYVGNAILHALATRKEPKP